MRRKAQTVWLLVVPGAELLDVSGPWEVLAHTNDVLGYMAYDLKLVGPTAPSLSTRHGLVLSSVGRLPRTPTRFPDIAIVTGGSPEHPMPAAETATAAWLARHHTKIPTLVSICTGAFVLGAAGLLNQRRVTTHWRFVEALKARFPLANVVDEGIFVRDENLWTSAGISAGVDLTLALAEAAHGHQVAMQVAKQLVLFLRRTGNQAQYSAALQRQEKAPPRSKDIATFVLEHLSEPLSVERLAAEVGMSTRTLTRWCRAELDTSPAELVRGLRIEEACRLLESTTLALPDIATRTGLGDASTLWRAFAERIGTTPAAYRQRFCAHQSHARLRAAKSN